MSSKDAVLNNGWDTEQVGSKEACSSAFAACDRIRQHVRVTPLDASPWLRSLGCCKQVLLKMESEQVTGSFKARGAVNKVLSLRADALHRGVYASSTGNHAMAVMHACSLRDGSNRSDSSAGASRRSSCGLGLAGCGVGKAGSSHGAAAACTDADLSQAGAESSSDLTPDAAVPGPASSPLPKPPPPSPPPRIYLPFGVNAFKLAKLQALNAEVVLFGQDVVEAEVEGRRAAVAAGGTYISPYNDPEVIAGQGTVAVELLQVLRPGQLDVVFVPVGGGGLISGIASVLKPTAPGVRVVGCQPAASDIMRRSVLAGHVVDEPSGDTLSEATAGGVEQGALTMSPCISLVDEWVVVSEEGIAAALVGLLEHHSKLAEGAAGVAIAAFQKMAMAGELAGKNVVIICCGGNIAIPTLQRVLAGGTPTGLPGA